VLYKVYVPHISMIKKVRPVFFSQVQIKLISPTKVLIATFLMMTKISKDSKIVSVTHLPLSNFITNLQAKLVGKKCQKKCLKSSDCVAYQTGDGRCFLFNERYHLDEEIEFPGVSCFTK